MTLNEEYTCDNKGCLNVPYFYHDGLKAVLCYTCAKKINPRLQNMLILKQAIADGYLRRD